MGSYAENEQDAREFAEMQRQFAEEKLEEQRERTKEKPVVTMDEILDHRFQQRNLENAERHMDAQNDWSTFLKNTNGGEASYFQMNSMERVTMMGLEPSPSGRS